MTKTKLQLNKKNIQRRLILFILYFSLIFYFFLNMILSSHCGCMCVTCNRMKSDILYKSFMQQHSLTCISILYLYFLMCLQRAYGKCGYTMRKLQANQSSWMILIIIPEFLFVDGSCVGIVWRLELILSLLFLCCYL